MTKRKTFKDMLETAGWRMANVRGSTARATTIYEKPGRVCKNGKPVRIYLGVRGMLRYGSTRKVSINIADCPLESLYFYL